MRSIKNALIFLNYHRKRTSVLILIFGILFLLLFTVINISWISDRQIKDLQDNMGKLIFVSKLRQEIAERNSLACFNEEEINTLTADQRVRGYNVLTSNYGNILSGDTYIEDSKRYNAYKERLGSDADHLDNCRLIGITDSKQSVFFSGMGFRLVKGAPLTIKEKNENVALVSQEIAKINNWKVGDKIELGTAHEFGQSAMQTFEVEIKGIYDCPENNFISDADYAPKELLQNFVFIPESTLYSFDTRLYQPLYVYIYIKDIENIEEYVSDMRNVLGEKVKDMTSNYSVKYQYKWNETWYKIVSTPLKEITIAASIVAIILSVVILAIIYLLSSWLLKDRKREMGILLSLGEKKSEVLKQCLIEQLLPIVIAAVLAGAISVQISHKVSRIMMEDTANQINQYFSAERELELFWDNSSKYRFEKDIANANYNFLEASANIDIEQSVGVVIGEIVGTNGVVLLLIVVEIFYVVNMRTRKLLQKGR